MQTSRKSANVYFYIVIGQNGCSVFMLEDSIVFDLDSIVFDLILVLLCCCLGFRKTSGRKKNISV